MQADEGLLQKERDDAATCMRKMQAQLRKKKVKGKATVITMRDAPAVKCTKDENNMLRRKHCKAMGRMAHLQALVKQVGPEEAVSTAAGKKLRMQVERHVDFTGSPEVVRQELREIRKTLTHVVEQKERDENNRRLADWHQRIHTDVREAARWVRAADHAGVRGPDEGRSMRKNP